MPALVASMPNVRRNRRKVLDTLSSWRRDGTITSHKTRIARRATSRMTSTFGRFVHGAARNWDMEHLGVRHRPNKAIGKSDKPKRRHRAAHRNVGKREATWGRMLSRRLFPLLQRGQPSLERLFIRRRERCEAREGGGSVHRTLSKPDRRFAARSSLMNNL
jgi:hypothetical protein